MGFIRLPLVFAACAALASAQPAAVPLASLLSGDGLVAGPLSPGRHYVARGRFRGPAGAPALRLSFRLAAATGEIAVAAAATLPADGQWHSAQGVWQLPARAPVSGLRLLVTATEGAKFESEGLTVYPVLTGLFNADDPAAVRRLGAEGVRTVWRCSELAEQLAAVDHPGHWQAAEEGGRPILRQTSPYLWSRIGLGSPEWRDYVFAVAVRPDQVNEDCGVVLRVCDRKANGCAEVTISNGRVVVRAIYAHTTQILAHAACEGRAGEFSDWRLRVQDGALTIEREGRELLTVANPVFAGGAIGLGTTSCTAAFADLSVRSLDGGATLLAGWPAGGWRQTDAQPFASLLRTASSGVPVVFTLVFGERAHPEKRKPGGARAVLEAGMMPDRIPVGAAADENLRTIDRFLTRYGRYLSVFSVENEPNFRYRPVDLALTNGTSRVIEWMKLVAAQARATSRAHPETLGRMTIAGPSLVSLVAEATDRNGYRASPAGRSFDAILAWENADPNIDLIDVHAHLASVAELRTCLDYICARSAKPLICTEWSEAACNLAWINRPVDPALLGASSLPNRAEVRTNDDYIRACYLHPVAKAEWDRFVGASHLTPDFIARGARLFEAHGFVLNTYGALIQFGDPMWDLKQLYANQTVVLSPDHQYQDNGTYPEQYRRWRERPTGP